MTKSKSSASSAALVIHLVNGTQLVNVNWVAECPIIDISPLTKM